MKTLNAEQFAENLSKALDQVACGPESFQIVKGGVPCACLVPVDSAQTDSHTFAEAIAGG